MIYYNGLTENCLLYREKHIIHFLIIVTITKYSILYHVHLSTLSEHICYIHSPRAFVYSIKLLPVCTCLTVFNITMTDSLAVDCVMI